MAVNSRQKGKVGERALCKELNYYGYECRRSQQFCGANGDADVVGIDGLHIECKVTAKGHGYTYDWIEQSINDARYGEIPVVMHKLQSKEQRGRQWLVTMELSDFIALWQKAYPHDRELP